MYNVMNFGACGDGLQIDTTSLQTAIDAASSANEELLIPRGTYLTGTLFLRNHTHITMEEGAVLLGSVDFADYSGNVNLFCDAVDTKRGRALIYAENAADIRLGGKGVIDGRGALFGETHQGHGERPFLVRILTSRNVQIEGLTLQKSASWGLHLMDCEDISVRDVKIFNRCNVNNDGIDIDSSRRCVIERCFIDSGDDAVCLKSTCNKPCADISVRNCVITTNWAGFKIGTESVGNFENITFTDSFIYDCNGCAIKICPVDGATVRNVLIDNIRLQSVTGPIFVANGERMRTYHAGQHRDTPGTVECLTISNVFGNCRNAVGSLWNGDAWGNAMACVCISGTDTNKLNNITVKNINLSMPGGAATYPFREVSEMGERYPEFHNFGVLPTWGMYVRHVRDLKTENITLQLFGEDVREEVVLCDVEAVEGVV
ncbi:hypothetical protein FACS189492_2650 [Clostridia bacterium]|nr:hypothetical protein FACS189492_2650 [Clostridia bacterium]